MVTINTKDKFVSCEI